MLRRFIVSIFVAVLAECILVTLAYAAEPIVVNVSVNGEAKGDFFAMRAEDGSFLLRSEDFASMRLLVPSEAVVDLTDGRYVALCKAKGVACSFREKTVSLIITVPASLLPKTKTVVEGQKFKEKDVYKPHETSLFLNYGVNYYYQDLYGYESYAVANKLGARSGKLLFLTDSLYRKTADQNDVVRLMSSVTYERRPELQWITFGDNFAYSGGLGSTLNMGGISLSKVYSIDPNFIKQPTATLSGVAEFPSQAFLYMDGRLVGTYRIQPGEFQLKDLLSYAGSHNYELVIRDAFGNERRISYPNYFSNLLLHQGLHEYSYNVGFLREQYGIISNEYGDAALSAFHRYGVNSFLTIGGRAESTKGLVNGGVQSAVAVPYAGVFLLEAAKSRENDRQGSAYSLQHNYQRDNISTSFAARSFSKEYETVATLNVPNTIRFQGNVTGQYGIDRWGSVALTYSFVEYFNDPERAERASTATINKILGNTGYLSLSAQRSNDGNYSVFVTYSYTGRDNGPYFSATTQRSRDMNAEAIQVNNRTPVGEGVAYRAAMTRSESNSRTTYGFDPYLQYNAPYGIYSIDARFQSGNDSTSNVYNLSASGSLVLVDGYFGVSRPVDNSFTVIMADKLPHVPILLNNEKIGETDNAGMIILPTVKSYYNNQVSVDARSIPMEYGLAGITAKISPSNWSGSCISFEVNKLQSVTGMLLVLEHGMKKPAEFYEVTMKAGDKEVRFPTGVGGEFYLDNVYPVGGSSDSSDEKTCGEIMKRRKVGGRTIKPGTYSAFIDYEKQKCEFEITFSDTDDPISDLGEVLCVIKKPLPVPDNRELSVSTPETPRAPVEAKRSEEMYEIKSLFGKNGAPVSKQEQMALSLIVRKMKSDPDMIMEIAVYAEGHGTKPANRRIAIKQIEALKRHLIASGVPANRIKNNDVAAMKITGAGRSRAVIRIVHETAGTMPAKEEQVSVKELDHP